MFIQDVAAKAVDRRQVLVNGNGMVVTEVNEIRMDNEPRELRVYDLFQEELIQTVVVVVGLFLEERLELGTKVERRDMLADSESTQTSHDLAAVIVMISNGMADDRMMAIRMCSLDEIPNTPSISCMNTTVGVSNEDNEFPGFASEGPIPFAEIINHKETMDHDS